MSDFTKASETLEMNNSDEDTDSDSSRNGIDIANILISLNGARLRYKVIPLSLVHYSAAAPVSYQIIKFWIFVKNCFLKDLLRIINMAVRKQLEPMFISYRKVVGAELSERMVYELQ